jgi:hypothetical protein
MKHFIHIGLAASLFTACWAASSYHGMGNAMVRRANELTTMCNNDHTLHEIVAKWDLENLTIAAVRKAPVNWPLPMLNKDWDSVTLDLNASVNLGIDLIKKASENQARVIGFPEVWFPGYPKVG